MERFGKYRLIRKIAEGGMAEIFLAKSEGAAGFEKTLILKRILPSLNARPRFVRMFVNEAKVTSLLSHGNIVQVFDFGRVGQEYFLAMEYVDGKDLRSIIQMVKAADARISVELVLYFMIQVLRALEYAHARSVVHRDVSPQNVLVAWSGEVKLADFGIAKVEDWSSQTRVGEVKGNWGYMAPEQAGAGTVGPRADLYSAGVVLYELLTRHNPFAKGSVPQVIRRIRDFTPPPPSHLTPGIAPSLDALVMRAIEKRPRDRFPCATAFMQALSEELFPTTTDSINPQVGGFLRALMEQKPVRVFAARESFFKDIDSRRNAAVVSQLLKQTDPTRPSSNAPSPRAGTSPPMGSVRKVRDLGSLGRIRLFVAPRQVDVFIDDRRVGAGAPVEIQTSANTQHRLLLRAPGYSEFQTTFCLNPGEVRNLSVVLASGLG